MTDKPAEPDGSADRKNGVRDDRSPGTPSADPHIRRIATGAGLSFLGRAAGAGLKYLTQVLLALFLGAGGFGLYGLAITLYQVGELISGLGLAAGSVRYVAMHSAAGDAARLKGVLLQTIVWPLLVGTGVGVGLFLASDFVAERLFDKPELAEPLRILAVAFPFGASLTAMAFATTGFQVATYLVSVRELLQPSANLLAIVLLCLAGYGLVGAAAAWVLAAAIGFVVSVALVRRLFPPLFRRDVTPIFEAARLMKFSLPQAFGDFLWLALIWTDIVILGLLRPAEEVGVYRAASQTALLISLFYGSFYTIFGPALAELYRTKDLAGMRRLFQTVTRWSFSLTLPFYLSLAIASADVLRIFGDGFEAGALPLVVLGAGYLVVAGTGGVHYMLTMSGHPYLKLAGDLALAVVNIGLNLVLIPRWGMMGAAIATAVSIAAVHALRILQVYRLLGVHPYGIRYVAVSAAGAVAGATGLLVHNSLDAGFLLSIAAVGATVFLIFAAFLWWLPLEAEDRAILDRISGLLAVRRQ